MNSASKVGLVTVRRSGDNQLLVRDVADIVEGSMPGEYDRYNMRRVVSMTANIEGADLGRVAREIEDAIQAAGAPPRGVTVDLRGQVVPLRQMFRGLTYG